MTDLRADVKFIIEERDRTFALMLERTERAEAEVTTLRAALLKAEEALVGLLNEKIRWCGGDEQISLSDLKAILALAKIRKITGEKK